jgi:hypothetical protein
LLRGGIPAISIGTRHGRHAQSILLTCDTLPRSLTTSTTIVARERR